MTLCNKKQVILPEICSESLEENVVPRAEIAVKLVGFFPHPAVPPLPPALIVEEGVNDVFPVKRDSDVIFLLRIRCTQWAIISKKKLIPIDIRFLFIYIALPSRFFMDTSIKTDSPPENKTPLQLKAERDRVLQLYFGTSKIGTFKQIVEETGLPNDLVRQNIVKNGRLSNLKI